jgi:hypothetical protein
VEVIKPLRYIFKFTFYGNYSFDFLHYCFSIASLEKSEKLGNYLSWSLVCFKYRSYFGSIDDGWRAAFPIHQDIIISTIPLESMKSASRVSNHRVAHCQ